MRTAEKNHYQNSMTISRIRVDNVLTNPFGKTVSQLMDYMRKNESFDENMCRQLIDRRVKASHDDIIDSIKSFHINPAQHFKMIHAKDHMNFIQVHFRNRN